MYVKEDLMSKEERMEERRGKVESPNWIRKSWVEFKINETLLKIEGKSNHGTKYDSVVKYVDGFISDGI